MRTLGFIGIALLAIINVLVLALSVQSRDWRGIALMVFMAGLLVFFARVLWRGAKLRKFPDAGTPLAEGWAGQPVSIFFREQVAKSIEGRILISGFMACAVMAAIVALAPNLVSIESHRAAASAMLFALWPVLAFVGYVKVCGQRYITSVFTVSATFAIVAAPFLIAYK